MKTTSDTKPAIEAIGAALKTSSTLHDQIVGVDGHVFDDLKLIKYPDKVSAHKYLKNAEKFCSIHQDLSDAVFALNLAIANLKHAQDMLTGNVKTADDEDEFF